MQEIFMIHTSFGGRYNKQNVIFGWRGWCCPLYCIIMYNCTTKEIKLQKEVNIGTDSTMTKREKDKRTNNDLQNTMQTQKRTKTDGEPKFLTGTIFLHAHLQAVYYNCVKFDQWNLNSSFCIHDARNFDEYTQVLAGDTTNKMSFLGGEEGAALCIALLCTIVLRRRLSSKKRSTWARKWLRRDAKLVSCVPGFRNVTYVLVIRWIYNN
jgi:hypothetical protein